MGGYCIPGFHHLALQVSANNSTVMPACLIALPEHAACEFPVHWDYTAFVTAAENHMTTLLANNGESQNFESPNGIPKEG
jgi:hypothetical protein